MMRLTVALLLIHTTYTVADLTAADFARFQAALGKCGGEHKVSQGVLSQALQGQPINDREFDCFSACLLDEMGLLNSDNSLKADVIISKIPQDAEFANSLIPIIQRCSNERNADKCAAAHSQFTCVIESGVPSLILG